MPKDTVLIIYEDFSTGGSTTSLFALLNAWDYDRYAVDLLPYRLSQAEKEQLASRLPPQVNILENAVKHGNSPKNRLIKGAKMLVSSHFHKAMKARKRGENKYVVLQHMAYAKTRLCRKIPENYRVAIAFIEGWSTAYLLSDRVKADKKFAFVHLDYKNAGLNPEIDRQALGKADGIIAVSEACRRRLSEIFPEYNDKLHKLENLHQTERIRKLSQKEPPEDFPEKVDFLTVCRPDIYVKGLDRMLNAAVNLLNSGYKFTWAVVGAGESARFAQMIEENGLSGVILPIATTENPYPCYTHADWFVLTSRTEAKPMTVTEAQILGTPCIVTEYPSAVEQIENGTDGIITENSTEGIVTALRQVLDQKELRSNYAAAIRSKQFDTKEEVNKLYELIESGGYK